MECGHVGAGRQVLLVTPRYWMQPELPRVTLLPIGLMLIIVLQFALGRVAYFDQAMLGALAAKDPAHFAALLEYASQKYEEYQRAVRAR